MICEEPICQWPRMPGISHYALVSLQEKKALLISLVHIEPAYILTGPVSYFKYQELTSKGT